MVLVKCYIARQVGTMLCCTIKICWGFYRGQYCLIGKIYSIRAHLWVFWQTSMDFQTTVSCSKVHGLSSWTVWDAVSRKRDRTCIKFRVNFSFNWTILAKKTIELKLLIHLQVKWCWIYLTMYIEENIKGTIF